MKARDALLIVGAAAGCMVLASCGGNGGNTVSTPPAAPPAAPPPPVTMELNAAAVLAIVQTKTSETAEPFQVNDAAVAVTPVGDETGAPISVDAT
jgi:hypothetical protein